MYQRACVQGLFVDPISERPVLLLRQWEEARVLPIWIGPSEAHAIAMRLDGISAPRPMTHDLLNDLIGRLGATVEQVQICDFQENTYFAQIVLSVGGREAILDARPSDAIALAVRAEAPVFVREDLFDRPLESAPEESVNADQELREWLESLRPDDLGHYEM